MSDTAIPADGPEAGDGPKAGEGMARYDSVSQTLHWLIAVAIILNIAGGLYMGDLPRGPEKVLLFTLHRSTGVTVLGLVLLRVIWRLMHPFLPLSASMPPLMKLAARGAHRLLYLLMVSVPLSGLLMTSAAKAHFLYFGLFQFPLIPGFDAMADPARKALDGQFHDAHVFLAWAMIVTLGLHIAAAFYHGLVRRDGVVSRMLPQF